MPGFDSLIRVSPADSWATAGTFGKRGIFLYADSENLNYGAQSSERDGKLIGQRESPIDTFSIDRYFPNGNIVIQPRVDDILPLLMAHFQNVVKSGTGTYTFYPLPTPLKFTQGGSNIGTHPYSLNVDLFFGQGFATGTQSNGIRFMNGIVDKLTFDLRYGEDLKITPEFKFLAGSLWTYPAGFGALSAYGSFSGFSRFVDYHGTVTVGSEDFDIDMWSGVFSNNTGDKSRLGKRGYNRFPLEGRYVAEGNFEMELNRDLNILAEGVYTSIVIDLTSSASNRIYISQPNIANRPFDIPLNGGDQLVQLSKGYRAYPPAGSTGPSTQVIVYTGTTFGTNLFGF